MKGFGLFLACLFCIFKKGLQSSGWSIQVPSDATGEIGKAVVLPCTFTHPHKTSDRTLTAIWRIKEPYDGMVVFKCVSHGSSDLCKTAVSYKNKYKLLGNPRHNNLSIRIDNLTWSDSNRYYCRVEFSGDLHDKYESRTGIRLHLIAAPRIVNITIGSNQDHTFKAQCTAEGEPLPSLSWTGPLYSNTTLVTSFNHQVTKELSFLTRDGKYTCTAVNSHGRAEGAVYFYKFKAASSSLILILMIVALGIKVLVLLAILGIAVFWRAGHVTTPSSLSRQQAQDSTYENLDRRNNHGSQGLPTE
ncbi:sialic acid-binding Ig-like lectin 15 [Emydura macquarii macquarii]|uniref:sialic acid-binding Ig-like lectin 15 n=1 Tax=Emydura macquarii macquarii TaxID=1129001 RepID=UPI00352A53EE